jgi:N-acetylglucosamine kinase-like BadF-type ATPase
MSPSVYVGVDSGGTRTNVDVVAFGGPDGTHSTTYEVGESLSGALAPDQVPAVLRRILAPLPIKLDELGLADFVVYAWVSAAGYTPSTRDDYIYALTDIIPTIGGGRISAVGVANDAVSVLLGSHADGIVIAGTGSSVILRTPDRVLYQSGGHEWVACDYGSGVWIGLRAIRQAYRDFESGDDSVILERLREVYGLRPNDDRALIAKLRDLAIGDPNMKREIARFAASVCAAAERGDHGAQNIVKAEAEDLADNMAGSLRRKFTVEQLGAGLKIVQCGSLLANPFYRSSFEGQLDMRLLSGIDHRAEIEWERMVTGGPAAVQLAKEVEAGSTEMLKLDLAFRPAVVVP